MPGREQVLSNQRKFELLFEVPPEAGVYGGVTLCGLRRKRAGVTDGGVELEATRQSEESLSAKLIVRAGAFVRGYSPGVT
jgi:hypothetical protein